MNFVPGEEKEGKMRIIHKEQVAVMHSIGIPLPIFLLVIIINIISTQDTFC